MSWPRLPGKPRLSGSSPYPELRPTGAMAVLRIARAGLVQRGILALHQSGGQKRHQDQHNGRRSSVQKDKVGEWPFVINQVRPNNIGTKESDIPNREDQ